MLGSVAADEANHRIRVLSVVSKKPALRDHACGVVFPTDTARPMKPVDHV
jgi:hypothetical protein